LTSKQFNNAREISIKSIEQLRQNTNEGSTLEIVYDLKGTGLTYKTASNLAIFPANSNEDIDLVAKIMNF
jgi:hypothetical protein